VTLRDELDRTRRTRGLIEELIADPAQLGPDFQAIRRLDDEALVGWKATGRGRPGTDVADTLALLAGAQSLGLVERLDWAFRCLAFDVAVRAGVDVPLHITPEPETFGSACPPRLAVSFGAGRRALTVVAELHDDAFVDERRLRGAVEEYRGWGWRIALADVSGEPGVAAALPWLGPDVVQVDLDRPGRAGDPAVRALVGETLDRGGEVMALGVDSPRRRDEAIGLGASVGRGLQLGAPGSLPY
jgi:EAL domain-containing protein (putative c-di-GMP-specific phosphodiesterase class I)